MAYGTIHAYAQDLEDALLIENTTGTRTLTPIGRLVLNRVSRLDKDIKYMKITLAEQAFREITSKYDLGQLPEEERRTLFNAIAESMTDTLPTDYEKLVESEEMTDVGREVDLGKFFDKKETIDVGQMVDDEEVLENGFDDVEESVPESSTDDSDDR